MLDKLEKSKSYEAVENHRNLYDALIKSYQLDKDLFDSYGKAYSLKRNHEEKDIGNTEDQPNVEATPRNDWFKKPKRPLTPDPK
ncbi:hypothetical protein Tco_0235370 [Tanacetum coccineum]